MPEGGGESLERREGERGSFFSFLRPTYTHTSRFCTQQHVVARRRRGKREHQFHLLNKLLSDDDILQKGGNNASGGFLPFRHTDKRRCYVRVGTGRSLLPISPRKREFFGKVLPRVLPCPRPKNDQNDTSSQTGRCPSIPPFCGFLT